MGALEAMVVSAGSAEVGRVEALKAEKSDPVDVTRTAGVQAGLDIT
jgi:hypothetical protein